MMSAATKRPPDRGTRWISPKRRDFRSERFTTPLEIATSAPPPRSGSPRAPRVEPLGVRRAHRRGVGGGRLQHLGEHVEPDGSPTRRHRKGRQDRVDPAPAAEVQDDLAPSERGGAHGVADLQRLCGRGGRQERELLGIVQPRGDAARLPRHGAAGLPGDLLDRGLADEVLGGPRGGGDVPRADPVASSVLMHASSRACTSGVSWDARPGAPQQLPELPGELQLPAAVPAEPQVLLELGFLGAPAIPIQALHGARGSRDGTVPAVVSVISAIS